MIALVGDYRSEVAAHQAIPHALALAGAAAGVECRWAWIGTETITAAAAQLGGYSGIWAVPASPYRNQDGALAAIRFARETGRPFLGTCGGFQHAIIEFARNIIGLPLADTAEIDPDGPEPVVTALACSLVGQSAPLHFAPGSILRAAYGRDSVIEGYRCSYGFGANYRNRFDAAGLRFTAFDDDGEIRAAEWPKHPFFVGTLFQPERTALTGNCPPLVTAFVQAAARFKP
jgi:CTP synthase